MKEARQRFAVLITFRRSNNNSPVIQQMQKI